MWNFLLLYVVHYSVVFLNLPLYILLGSTARWGGWQLHDNSSPILSILCTSAPRAHTHPPQVILDILVDNIKTENFFDREIFSKLQGKNKMVRGKKKKTFKVMKTFWQIIKEQTNWKNIELHLQILNL